MAPSPPTKNVGGEGPRSAISCQFLEIVLRSIYPSAAFVAFEPLAPLALAATAVVDIFLT